MTLTRYFALLLFLAPFCSLVGQCLTVDEIREDMADSTFAVESYVTELSANCPTASDSLGPAFYSRTLFFYGLDDLEKSIEYGVFTLRELRKADTTLQLGKMAYNMGLFYLEISDNRSAMEYFRQAAELFPIIDHPQSGRRYRQALIDLGYSYKLLGDYQRGEEVLQRAVREARLAEDGLRVAFASVKLGDLYMKSGDLGAAAGAYEVAIAGFENEGQDEWLANTRISRLAMYQEQKAYEPAFSELESLLKVKDRLDGWNLAQLYSIGIILGVDAKDANTAEAFFQENLALVTRMSSRAPELIAQAWDNGGSISMLNADYKQAADRFGNAINELVPDFTLTAETPVPNNNQLSASHNKVDLLVYLGDLARAYSAGGRQEDALATLRAADVVTDLLRDGLGGEVSALMWREKALPIYEQGIQLSYELGQPENAFYFFEKSRAVLLLEALAENDLRGSLPKREAGRLALAEQELRDVQRSLLTASKAEKDSIANSLATTRQKVMDLREGLAADYPAAFPEAGAGIVSLAQARANLKKGGFVLQLQYFMGAERTYLFVLDAEGMKTLDLGPTVEVASVVRPLLGYFTDAKTYDTDPAGYNRAAHLAFTTLVAPASAPKNAPLLILPDGLLSYLPFAALVTDPEAAAPYLLQRNPTAYAQSATLFGRTRTAPLPGALAFTPFTQSLASQSEPELPFSTREADALEKTFFADRLNGAAATRSALLDTAGHYSILHLATHAWAARDADAPPRILTADAPLFLPDVYGMNLNGALVSLSACRSNVGPLARGEGVLGLGRAFRAAGAGGVVASLWSLNDRTTADITTSFYERLAAGEAKPFALHAAQRDFLTREDLPAYLKSPYYWAGLTYYGDAATVAVPFRISWWMWTLGILLVVVFGGLLWRRVV